LTGLLDIAPQSADVDVGGHSLAVHGVTLQDIADLLRRFPELRALFGGGEEAMDRAATALPGLVAAIIAAGLGHPGDLKHEKAAARLPAEAQSKLFGAIVRLTMPAGIALSSKGWLARSDSAPRRRH